MPRPYCLFVLLVATLGCRTAGGTPTPPATPPLPDEAGAEESRPGSQAARAGFDAVTAALDRMAYTEALVAAERLSAAQPRSGQARFLRAEALYHLGRRPEAMVVAYGALDDARVVHAGGSGGALLGLVVSDGIRAGRIRQTAAYLLKRYPVLATPEALAPATGFASLAAPLHAVQYLALLQARLGRVDEARALQAHHSFVTRDFLTKGRQRPLSGIQHWLLASVGLGRWPPSRVLDHLEAAWDGGFKSGWGYNYRLHATFAPLWDHPRYVDLIQRIVAARGPPSPPNKTLAPFEWLLGEWSYVDEALPAAGFEHRETGTRRCQKELRGAYIVCHIHSDAGRGPHESKMFIRYDSIAGRYEMIGMFSFFPGISRFHLVPSRSGRQIDLIGAPMPLPRGRVSRNWGRILYDGKSSYRWETRLNRNDDAPGHWPLTLVDEGRRAALSVK